MTAGLAALLLLVTLVAVEPPSAHAVGSSEPPPIPNFTPEPEEAADGPVVVGVWNNHFETVTDGVFVQWSENIRPEPYQTNPWGRYSIHEQDDCSDAAVAHGVAGHWTGGRPDIRDLEVHDWDNVAQGETYYLRVLPETELGTVSNQPNPLVPCFEFVTEMHEQDQSTFEGQVTDAATDEPIEGATVTVTRARREPGTVAGQATTGSDGTYSVEHLAPGPYEVTADADGYQAVIQPATAQGGANVTVDFALEVDSTGPGAIAGTVTDAATDAPIEGATVTAVDAGGGERSATTAGDGTYEISALAPGAYTVTAAAAGYHPSESQPVTVVAGETAAVNIALMAEPTDPTSRAECMQGGWRNYGFSNQGQCIMYVETGRDMR